MADKTTNHAANPPSPRPRALPVLRQILILAGIAVGVGLIVVLTVFLASGEPTLSVAAQPSPASGVFKPSAEELAGLSIKPVEEMPFRSETITEGSIATDDNLTTPVYSQLSGRVTQVIASPGDHVGNGAPLAVVEASEVAQAQNDLIAAKSALSTARAQLDLAHTNEQRQHDLYDAQGAALRDWQQSQVDLSAAEATYRSADIALATVRQRLAILGKSRDEIAAMENEPDMRAVNATTIRAPIAGTVLQRQIGLGQYIQAASSTPLFMIGDLSTVWLVADVREVDAPRVHLGDIVEVHALAYPDRIFKAKISYVAPSIDANTHRLLVRADIDNRDGALKPQMFATFSIITGEGTVSPAVPQSAILYDGDSPRVWVLDPNGVLNLRAFRAGRTNGTMVEAVDGLKAGEKIVTGGTIFIDRAATGG